MEMDELERIRATGDEYHRIYGWARPPEYKHWFEGRAGDTERLYCICGISMRMPTHDSIN